MSTFGWIAWALWVSAACQVYDRIPWGCRLSLEWPAGRRFRAWCWAKALALRSWVFDEGYHAAAVAAPRPLFDLEDYDFTTTQDGEWTTITITPKVREPEYKAPVRPAEEVMPPPPRRRPTRSEAAKARKKGTR